MSVISMNRGAKRAQVVTKQRGLTLLCVSVSAWALSAATTPVYAQATDECRLTVNESAVDFGRFNRIVMAARAGEAPLGQRVLMLTLSCPQPRDLTLHFRAITAGIDRFGFPGTGGATYTLSASDAVLDGEAVSLGLVEGDGAPPSVIAPRLLWRPERGLVPVRAGQPAEGSALSMRLEIEGWIRTDSVSVRDASHWQSDGLIEAVEANASHDLAVQFDVIPAACTPRVSGGGVLDFGRISVGDLAAHGETSLPPRRAALEVTCDGPALFALRAIDNKVGTANSTATLDYGLGLAGSAKIGRFTMIAPLAGVTLDGSVARVAHWSFDNGGNWGQNPSLAHFSHDRLVGLSKTPSETSPSMITNATVPIDVSPVIADKVTLPVSDVISFDGHVTFEVVYL